MTKVLFSRECVLMTKVLFSFWERVSNIDINFTKILAARYTFS